jgi:hypothetical protein
VRTIRRRVIAGAVALFVATWLLITLMLVTGHDPALASQKTTARAATQTTSSKSANTGTSGGTSSSTGTSSSSTGTSSSSTGTSSSSTGTSSVSSRQS